MRRHWRIAVLVCLLAALTLSPAAAQTVAPDTVIVGGPTGATFDDTPTWHFVSATAGSTFQCRVDRGPFVDCSTGHYESRPLAAGTHLFEVRAVSPAGIPDPSPAAAEFEVVPPPRLTRTV